MFKVIIYIAQCDKLSPYQDGAHTEIELSRIPRKGESLFLTHETQKELERQVWDYALSKEYYPIWYRYKKREGFSCVDANGLTFEDAHLVKEVFYHQGKNIIEIILDKQKIK